MAMTMERLEMKPKERWRRRLKVCIAEVPGFVPECDAHLHAPFRADWDHPMKLSIASDLKVQLGIGGANYKEIRRKQNLGLKFGCESQAVNPKCFPSRTRSSIRKPTRRRQLQRNHKATKFRPEIWL